MKRIAALAACALLLVGCNDQSQKVGDTAAGSIRIWHDDQRSVTCWIFGEGYRGGLSCIPDTQLPKAGDPGCVPGTETPGEIIDGKQFPGTCVSRRYAGGAR